MCGVESESSSALPFFIFLVEQDLRFEDVRRERALLKLFSRRYYMEICIERWRYCYYLDPENRKGKIIEKGEAAVSYILSKKLGSKTTARGYPASASHSKPP